MNWTKNGRDWELDVPIELWEGMSGNYHIVCVKRPPYCDRGDWLIYVAGTTDLDYQDGFPRYFLGSEEDVKRQMEAWLDKREAYRRWMKKAISSVTE
jgi:hypothetical protein